MSNSTQTAPTDTVDSLAAKIKAKYPVYASMDNKTLVSKIVAKYPAYAKQLKPQTPSEPSIASGFEGGHSAEEAPKAFSEEAIKNDPHWYTKGLRYILGVSSAIGRSPQEMADFVQSQLKQSQQNPQKWAQSIPSQAGEQAKGLGKTAVGMFQPETYKDPEKFGNQITNLIMLAAGGKEGIEDIGALDKAKAIAKNAPDKAKLLLPWKRASLEEAYLHAKGFDIQNKVAKAVKNVRDEIALHSKSVADAVDSAEPKGAIDAQGEADVIKKAFSDVVKLPGVKLSANLAKAVKDAEATGTWTFEKTRQFRSDIGAELGSSYGPMKAVLSKIYGDLTKKLSEAATKYGMTKSFNKFNELERKLDQQFGDYLSDIKKGQTGKEIAARLMTDPAETQEVINRNLSKYAEKSKDGKDLAKEVSDYSKFAKTTISSKFKRGLFSLIYGSPAGASAYIGARMAGAPWITSLGLGGAAGLLSNYVLHTVRAMKLDPAIIEDMLSRRELPGKSAPDKPIVPPKSEATTSPTEPPKSHTPAEAAKALAQAQAKARAEKGVSEPTKVASVEERGKGIVGKRTADRERIAKKREEASRTQVKESKEELARQVAKPSSQTPTTIPEMEEFVQENMPDDYKSLRSMRKKGSIDEESYIAGLKYYVEHYNDLH